MSSQPCCAAFSLALGAPPRAGADSPPYGSVTGATAHLSSLASGATGVTWVVRFRTSGAGALVAGYGTVTLIAPPGTVLPTSGILSDPGSSAGPAPAPAEAAVTAGGAIANFTVPSKVSSDTEVELSLSGVTNPPASGPQSLAVTTSSDIDPATVTFSLKGSGRNLGRVISPTVQLSSAAAGASQLNLEVTFTLPAGGSLAASTGEIFLVGPPGETFGDGGTIKDLTTGKSGGFNGVLGGVTVIGNGAVLAVSTTIPLNAGDRVLLTNSGAANPGDPDRSPRDRDLGGSRLGGNRLHDRAGLQRHKCRRHVVVVVRRRGGEHAQHRLSGLGDRGHRGRPG